METTPDTILITASQKEEVKATHAELFVTVRGTSLISGDTALKKAKEVNQLVEELGAAGLPGEDIEILGVHAETTSGAILKTSSATYRLRIRCQKLEQFAELLGVITSQKNASLEKVEWKYPDEEILAQALEKAIQKAQAKARKTAAALGVKLLGVFSFDEKNNDPENTAVQMVLGPQARTRSMGVVSQPVDFGMDIQHSKTVEVLVEIEYRVSGFEAA